MPATRSGELDVAAAAMQRNDGGFTRTLAMRKSTGPMRGYWEFPGGKREEGETMSDCLVREIKEELNIDITVGDLLAVNNHRTDSRTINLHAFRVTQWSGDIRLTDHDEMRWLQHSDLHSLRWSPADVFFVDILSAEHPCGSVK